MEQEGQEDDDGGASEHLLNFYSRLVLNVNDLIVF